MTRALTFKLIESSGRRTEMLVNVTESEAALATKSAGSIGAAAMTVQRGRRGVLYAAKQVAGLTVSCDGWNDIVGQAVPAGSGKPVRALIYLGQSDANGRAAAGDPDLDAPDPSVASRCTLFDLSYDYGEAAEPSSDLSGAILSIFNDAGFASSGLTRTLSQFALADADHEYLGIPCALGATSSQDWQGGVAVPTTNTLIGGAIKRALSASRVFASRGFEIVGVSIGQMTTNASTPALAARWASDWDECCDLIESKLAGLFVADTMRSVGWRFQVTKPPGLAYAEADCAALRANQDTWVSNVRKLVQTPDGPYVDLIHLNNVGQKALADAIAAVFISNGWLS